MKKLLLTIGILLVGLITFAQPTGVNKKWTFPDLIEVPKLLVGDATSNTVITIDSIANVSGGDEIAIYDGADTLGYYIPYEDRVEGVALGDTRLYFAPCVGVGNAGDTIAFTLNNVIWGAKWEGSHSLVITKVTAVVAGTSPDIDLALLYDANYKDGTPTEVFSSDLTVTSTTTGDNATINSSNDTIASGTWLWLRVDQATAKPTQCIVNIYGYLE